MTIQETLAWLKETLSQKYPPQEAALLARQLIQWALEVPDTYLVTHASAPLSLEAQEKLYTTVEQHVQSHKPLQYIVGSAPFLSSMILVRPPMLIPRPETEQWAHFIISHLRKLNKSDLTLLDMGTGSGCIAVSLAQAFPEATVYAVDTNPDALVLTQENAALNSCTNITLIESDLFENVPDITFDCIVSNPPYVTEEEWETLDPVVKEWEDRQALVAYDYGLRIIKALIAQAPQRLKKDPLFAELQVPQLLIEIGETQGNEVASLMTAAGFTPTIHQDDAGKDRFVTGVLDATTD